MRGAIRLVALFAALTGLWLVGGWFIPGPLSADKTFVVAQGDSLSSVAAQLEREGAIGSARIFRLRAQLLGGNEPVKAGRFLLPKGASQRGVLAILQGEDVQRRFVTIPEGMASIMVRDRLMATEGLTGDIPIPPEGSILPDTYEIGAGESRAAVIARMQAAMNKTLAELWAARSADTAAKTPEEAIILAGIIEKETGKAEERHLIAGLYTNRLRINMATPGRPDGAVRDEGAAGARPLSASHDRLALQHLQVSRTPAGPDRGTREGEPRGRALPGEGALPVLRGPSGWASRVPHDLRGTPRGDQVCAGGGAVGFAGAARFDRARGLAPLVAKEISPQQDGVTQVLMLDLAALARGLHMEHHPEAAREGALDRELLRTDQRDIGPPEHPSGVRGELAREVWRGGEERGDDVGGRDVVLVHDRREELEDGGADLAWLVRGDGDGATDGADGASGIRHRSKLLHSCGCLALTP